MGKRLTQITTRGGDDGTTGLGDSTRTSKASHRICAIGEVDELNSHIGVLLCEPMPADVRELLVEVQHQLFDLGGELSMPGRQVLGEEAVRRLEEALRVHNAQLPRLDEFILPAGSRATAQAHVCRTVARRAERALVALQTQEQAHAASGGPTARHYLNRLSDLLFVLSRVLARMDGAQEVYWSSARLKRAQSHPA